MTGGGRPKTVVADIQQTKKTAKAVFFTDGTLVNH